MMAFADDADPQIESCLPATARTGPLMWLTSIGPGSTTRGPRIHAARAPLSPAVFTSDDGEYTTAPWKSVGK